jgi:hypothetical protein
MFPTKKHTIPLLTSTIAMSSTSLSSSSSTTTAATSTNSSSSSSSSSNSPKEDDDVVKEEEEEEEEEEDENEQRRRRQRRKIVVRFQLTPQVRFISSCLDYQPKERFAVWGTPNEWYLQRQAFQNDVKRLVHAQAQAQAQQTQQQQQPQQQQQQQPQQELIAQSQSQSLLPQHVRPEGLVQRQVSDNLTFSTLGLWDKTRLGKACKLQVRNEALEAVRSEIVAQWKVHTKKTKMNNNITLQQPQQQQQETKDENSDEEQRGDDDDDDDESLSSASSSCSSCFSSGSSSSSATVSAVPFSPNYDVIAVAYQKVTYKAQQKAHQDALQLERDVVKL